MNLYIRINQNKPVDHPIVEDNFIQAFPEIDISNLPNNFARFERIDIPEVGVYQIYEGVVYDWEDGVVKDVHKIRDMTQEEILSFQNQVKSDWESTGFASWIFNEETCSFDPPTPYPDGDNSYIWNEELENWERINVI